LRGGSWNNNDNNCRVANRNHNNPDNRNNNNGFRLLSVQGIVRMNKRFSYPLYIPYPRPNPGFKFNKELRTNKKRNCLASNHYENEAIY
jgi:hypothetical protein